MKRFSCAVSIIILFSSGAVARRPKKPVVPATPQVAANIETMAEPPVSAQSAIIVDAASGRVLWGRNIDAPHFPASTTKILTAILLLEHTKPDDVITAPKEVTEVGESSLHLQSGEKLTAHDLLLGTMLRSANDGCYTAAVHIAGSVQKFADLMNEKAAQLGCTNSHFVTPNGLHDPQHVVTARDMALIARHAMTIPGFRTVVKTQKAVIQRSISEDTVIKNRDTLLTVDPTLEGIKTGYTVPAGHCFVGANFRQGWRVITVILNSKDWRTDQMNLAAWAFSHFKPQDVMKVGRPSPAPTDIPIRASRSTIVAMGPDEIANVTPQVHVHPPVKRGAVVGAYLVNIRGEVVAQIPAIATQDVSAPLIQRIEKRTGSTTSKIIAGGTVAGLAALAWRVRRIR